MWCGSFLEKKKKKLTILGSEALTVKVLDFVAADGAELLSGNALCTAGSSSSSLIQKGSINGQ